MDTLFHFVFSLLAGLALDIRTRHKLKYIIPIAFFSVAIDVDHLSPAGSRGIFHNIFITVLMPLVLLVVFYFYEKRREIRLQTYALLLLVMLAGHVVADMFYGGEVKLLYPFSTKDYAFPNILVTATSDFYSPIIAREGIVLAIYFLILLPAVFIEDFLYYFRRKHEREKKALSKVQEDLI